MLEYCSKESEHYSNYAATTFLVYFQEILNSLVAAIVSAVNKSIYEYIEELCYRIILMQEGTVWLSKSLAQVPYDCLTEAEKNKFLVETQQIERINNL